MTDIEFPEDTRPSRLDRKPKSEVPDDFVSADRRLARFRQVYPLGFHDTVLDRVIEHQDGTVTYVVQALVWKVKGEGSPDATAYASRSTTAEFALEVADTVARSRALRNLGILAAPKKTKP